MSLTRRDLLRGAGAAMAASALPGCDASSPLAPARIETIVLLMMENRSYDHIFGGLSLEEGRAIDGLLTSHFNIAGDGARVSPSRLTSPCVHPDPPHSWGSSHRAVDAGSMARFVQEYEASGADPATRYQVLSYLNRTQQPITYALADRYALCNRWFSSLLTSTWPNRLYFHGAQSQGMKSNDLPGGAFTMRTVWDQLTEAGTDWAYFFSDLPTLGLFGGRVAGHLSLIEDFFVAAANGTLPPVVCVDAATRLNDDHPPNHPMLGQLFIGSIYNALAASPHWPNCLFVVTYDEAGGFFDHVAPPRFPDDLAVDGFDQGGVRVPAFVAGPYVKNMVSSTVREHSSALTEIQRWHDLPPLNLRNAGAADLSELLDVDRMAAHEPADPIELPLLTLTESEILAQCSQRGGSTGGQPEMEAALRELGLGWADRTAESAKLLRFFLDTAESLGVARVV